MWLQQGRASGVVMFWSSVGNAAIRSIRADPGCLTGLFWCGTRLDVEQRLFSEPSSSLLCTDCLTVSVWYTASPMNIWILKSGPSEQRAGLKEMEEITAVSGSLILHSVMEMSRQEAVMFWRWSVTETHFNILCCLLCLFVYLQGSILTTLWSFVSHFLFE